MNYIFNGDFVDRGAHQLECVTLLFSLKALYPDQIILVRGNHEFREQNMSMGESGFWWVKREILLIIYRHGPLNMSQFAGGHVNHTSPRIHLWLSVSTTGETTKDYIQVTLASSFVSHWP